MASAIRYRGYTISHRPKPIPSDQFDWEFVHDDYDVAPRESGGSPADQRCGYAASSDAAKLEIDELILDGD